MSVRFTYPALGTKWWIELFEDVDKERLAVIQDDCEAFSSLFEANYSRFKPDSLITKLNTERQLTNPSEELVELLKYGKQLYLQTDARFNILTGHIQEAKGYDADYSFKSQVALPVPGNPITDLNIDADKISLEGKGKVDIGGFGKGYLIDRLAERLQTKYGLKYFLVNGGGDIYATSDNGKPIEIHLEHPTKPDTSLGTTTLLNEAFAASSIHKRKWKSESGEHNHIIHPNKDTVFVKAKSAKEADVLATVKLLTG